MSNPNDTIGKEDTSLRYERINPCGTCAMCKKRTWCEPARTNLRAYSGIRPTSDGFDCALPVSIDSHSVCAYGCLYCFSDNTLQHRDARLKPMGQTSLGSIERLFDGEGGKWFDLLRKALKYDNRNENGYPCPVQLGAINDPGDHIELQQGWLLKFLDLAIKYRQPVRMSTKGTVFLHADYLKAIAQAPELFWVAFSIITPDDEVIAKVDRRAPPASKRLQAMKNLSDLGVKTSLRFRPILPGISDRTKNYPQAWKTLIDKAVEAGAYATSIECGFVPGAMTRTLAARWKRLGEIAGLDFKKVYRSFGPSQSCMRPAYTWTEEIMHAVTEHARESGLSVGVSDPVWKQLGDTGCCCGIKPDDPVFGNWQREQATNALLRARDDRDLEVGPNDAIPSWAWEAGLTGIVNPGTGPRVAYSHRHKKWGDALKDTWNGLSKQRGVLAYFQGALMVSRIDENGDVYYKYKGLDRQYPTKTPYWKV